jgi:hypothetical protein
LRAGSGRSTRSSRRASDCCSAGARDARAGVQLEDDADALREPLTATRSLGGTLGILDLRGDHAASAVLAELGGTIDIRQHEMVHRL